MAAAAQKPKLIAIVGPTASGKSELALKVAKRFNGEIITADSRTIYRGMDIGTAKASEKEQLEVPHWGLDLINPGETYSAARFKEYADKKIREIQKRGRLPIMVGGTGLYIDSVLFNFSFAPLPHPRKRQKLERLNVSELQALIEAKGLEMPQNTKNKRHLIRAVEIDGVLKNRAEIKKSTLVIGLMPPPQVLRQRINKRAEQIFLGALGETEQLFQAHRRENIVKTAGIVYEICLDIIDNKINVEQGIELFKTADWQYARRQRTWFKRNPHVKWFEDVAGAFTAIVREMNT